jgi:hypothetical protein
VKTFNVAKFIGMYEVEGGGADELMRLVTYPYLSGISWRGNVETHPEVH